MSEDVYYLKIDLKEAEKGVKRMMEDLDERCNKLTPLKKLPDWILNYYEDHPEYRPSDGSQRWLGKSEQGG